ncbi:MAG: membrane protein insertion efficiency factor YidD [Candidatus Omnitrophica bacterium]|nr:membrane protein insertion efficiency factor YidD [Candidatus Omnitrophota bacterium]
MNVGSVLSKIAIFFLRVYRGIFSPLLPHSCRFWPSCSSYMREAIEKKGICIGLILGVIRILKCHPFNRGGYNPVR